LFSVRPPIRVDVDAPAIAPKRRQVIVRVGDIVARAAIPDFEIDDIAFATVDEMVPERPLFARRKGAAQMLGVGGAAARLNRRRIENREWAGI